MIEDVVDDLRPRVYPFTTLNYRTHIEIWDTTRFMVNLPLLLARSFIQCHLSPVRSVHHPGNKKPHYPWLGSPGLARPVYSGAATLLI